jgi:NADH-quinone oxidoreductase subunit A
MSAELVLSTAALIGIAAIIPCLMVLTALLGPRSGGRIKNEAYESGIGKTIGSADQKFSVKFYLLAILFLIFDIEAVFM